MSWRTWTGGALAAGAAVASGVVWTSSTEQTVERSAASEGRQFEGATLFESRGCSGCHSRESYTGGPNPAPNLFQIEEWAGERVPGLSAEEYVAQSIRTPGAFISPEFTPRNGLEGMPDLHLTEPEIAALVDYLLKD